MALAKHLRVRVVEMSRPHSFRVVCTLQAAARCAVAASASETHGLPYSLPNRATNASVISHTARYGRRQLDKLLSGNRVDTVSVAFLGCLSCFLGMVMHLTIPAAKV
jgi:hypothetical protein